MTSVHRPLAAAGLVAAALTVVTATGVGAQQAAQQPPDPPARPELVRQPYSEADLEFMAGMIPHHAQAVLMAGWASHGAGRDVRVLCERIVVGQRDEIEFMRNWLRDRGQTVPARDATHHRMKVANGMEHDMLMPGMLTPEEMAALDKARGAAWDRLFLTGMIKHHGGAIKMVDDLFKSYGALQDDDVYKFASDIYADQGIEIERMEKMLNGVKK